MTTFGKFLFLSPFSFLFGAPRKPTDGHHVHKRGQVLQSNNQPFMINSWQDL